MTEEPSEQIIAESTEAAQGIQKPNPGVRYLFGALLLVGVSLLGGGTYVHFLNQPPLQFPIQTPIPIAPGTEVREITDILESNGVVRSSTLLYYIITLFHEPTSLKASTYVFEAPLTATEVASKLTLGDFDTDLVRITHFEGERIAKLADRVADELPNFNKTAFVTEAEPLEGRLFPDTYFIPKISPKLSCLTYCVVPLIQN